LRQLVRLPLAFIGEGGAGKAHEGHGQEDRFEQDKSPG